MRKPWKKVELIVYENETDMSRLEYKGRVIQTYTYGETLVHFVMKENGLDDAEFLCLLEAIRYIDKVTK